MPSVLRVKALKQRWFQKKSYVPLQVIMYCGAAEKEVQFEKNEPYIIKNNSCKLISNKNGIKKCDILKLIDTFKTNCISCLDLSNCLLLEFPSILCNLNGITELNIAGNELETLPNEFVNMKKMRILNISNNLFKEFPLVFYNGLHLIKVLTVSDNQITHFDKAPLCLPKLQHLDFSSNKLVNTPNWLILNLPSSLEYIDLSNNPCFGPHFEIKKSNMTIGKVADLIKTLKISNCQYRNSTEGYMQNFSNLHTLDMGNNSSQRNFTNLLAEVKCLPKSIEQLAICDVGLSIVSKIITDLPKLRYLDISRNSIHWLQISIKNLKSLVVLRANSCSLCLLPTEMNELTNLRELYLSSNQLNSTEGFEKLVNIEVLDLYDNQLISLPNLDQFTKLTALDLCLNYVEAPSSIQINDVKHNYEELKICLRSKIQDSTRMDDTKEFPASPENELSDNYSDYSSECELNMSGMDELAIEEPIEDGRQCYLKNEDSWEEDETDHFDPAVYGKNQSMWPQPKKSASYDSLTGEIPFEVTTNPHYFAPYQAVTPTVVVKSALPQPVEGQFDD